MREWNTSQKVAATLILVLLGIGYLVGVSKLSSSVGLAPEQVKARYSAKPEPVGLTESLAALMDAEPEISGEKLTHVAHAHMIPYTLVFALCAFFIVHFGWSPRAQVLFMVAFALSIPFDFLSMAATRFIHPSFYVGILLSGLAFGACLGVTIFWSFYELWISKPD